MRVVRRGSDRAGDDQGGHAAGLRPHRGLSRTRDQPVPAAVEPGWWRGSGLTGGRGGPRRLLGGERELRAHLVGDPELRLPDDAPRQLGDPGERQAGRLLRRRCVGDLADVHLGEHLEVAVGREVLRLRHRDELGTGRDRCADLLGAEDLQPVPGGRSGRPAHHGGDTDDGHDRAAQAGAPPADRGEGAGVLPLVALGVGRQPTPGRVQVRV